MKQYNIRVTNTTKVALTIIFGPIAVMPVMLYGLLHWPGFPDWVIAIWICLNIGLAGVFTFYLVKKMLPKAVLTVSDDGFSVDFLDKNFFTPAPFEIKIHQVANFYVEGANGMYYMSFKTSTYPYSFNIEARSKKEEEINTFLELIGVISKMVEKNNYAQSKEVLNNKVLGNDSGIITSVTMYEKPWAKVLIIFAALVFLGVLFMAILMPGADSVPWVRISALIAFGIPFAYKVYYHNYKKRKK